MFNLDVLLSITPYLESRELVNLALTCGCLGLAPEYHSWSLVEEVSRELLTKSVTKEEDDCIIRYQCPNGCGEGESWIGLLHELDLLRSPLTFDQLVGDRNRNRLEYVNRDRSCITSSNSDEISMDLLEDTWTGTPQTAICSDHIMRSGKHYATFTFTGSGRFCYFFPGIVRPMKGLDEVGLTSFAFWWNEGYDYFLAENNGRWGESNVNFCMYSTYSGECMWGDWRTPHRRGVGWNGMCGFELEDGKIGLLLDLDEGVLAVYKDGRRLGVMKDVSSI
jgi:hypothetical protein